MKDAFGVKLEVGQYVAYAGRRANSGNLRIGVIRKLNPDSISIQGGECDYQGNFQASERTGVFVSYPDNIVIIPESIVPDSIRLQFGTLRIITTS